MWETVFIVCFAATQVSENPCVRDEPSMALEDHFGPYHSREVCEARLTHMSNAAPLPPLVMMLVDEYAKQGIPLDTERQVMVGRWCIPTPAA